MVAVAVASGNAIFSYSGSNILNQNFLAELCSCGLRLEYLSPLLWI